MTNTDKLYTAIRDFTNTRRENRETYLRKKKGLESYKGSAGYQKDLDAAMKVRKDADKIARDACKKTVDEALNDMIKKNQSRGIVPPSDEAIRILTVAQMLKKPSKSTLDSIANSLGGNALALAALTDIAKEAYKDDPNRLEQYIRNYAADATEDLGAAEAQAAIKTLGSVCSRIMNGSGANHVRELTAEHHKRVYNQDYDPDDLPQEEPYSSERDFYDRTISVKYDLFAKAVN